MENGRQKTCATVMKTGELKKSDTWTSMMDVEELAIMDDDNKLDDVPKEIGKLNSLTSFQLSWGSMKKVPRLVFGLGLRRLILDRNDIREIDAKIKLSTNLIYLDLSHNKIKRLPREIAQVGSLEVLNVSANSITELPEQIGEFLNLRELNISSNSLNFIPESIGDIKSLESLDFCNNNLSNLPKGLGHLPNLRDLRVSNNHLSVTLPPTLGHLKSLRSLLVSANRLSELPKSLSECANLVTINAKSNDLTQMYCSPPNIQVLLLDKNEFEMIPDSVLRCTELQTLSMEDNCIKDLDSRIGKLKKLRSLRLGGNTIAAIPQEICHLVQLRHLSMRSARVRSLPPGFDALNSLTVLDLSDNPLDHQLYIAYREGIERTMEHVKNNRDATLSFKPPPDDSNDSPGSSDSEKDLEEYTEDEDEEEEEEDGDVFQASENDPKTRDSRLTGDEEKDQVGGLPPPLHPKVYGDNSVKRKSRPNSETNLGVLKNNLTISPPSTGASNSFLYATNPPDGQGPVSMRAKAPLSQKDSGYTSQPPVSEVMDSPNTARIQFKEGDHSSYIQIPANSNGNEAATSQTAGKPVKPPKPAVKPKPPNKPSTDAAHRRLTSTPETGEKQTIDLKRTASLPPAVIDRVARASIYPPSQ